MNAAVWFVLFLTTEACTEDPSLTENVLYLPPYAGLLNHYQGQFSRTFRTKMIRGVNMTGGRLKVVTCNQPPFVAYNKVANGTVMPGNRTGPGVVIEILEEMRKELSLEYDYVECDSEQWGEETETGNWTGMIGMLQRKEADIIAGASALRRDRLSVSEMSYPFYSSETGMLIRSPSRYLENRFLIVTAPFQTRVWALSLLAIFVSGCVMKALCKALNEASEIQYTWIDSMWIFFSVFVQQGLHIQPRSWTCRTMLAFWWLAALTLAATFTGNMVALFAVNKAAFPFNNREELLYHVQYKGYKVVTADDAGTWVKFLQTSQLQVFKELWHEMTVKKKWMKVTGLDKGVDLVKAHPKLVLLGPMETLNVYAASDCAVTTTSNGIIPVMYTILLQKGSPYAEVLSNVSRELVETGIITKWMRDYHFRLASEKGTFCVFSEGATAAGEAVDVIRAQGAFWILVGGVVFATVCILVELWTRSMNCQSSPRSVFNTIIRKTGEMDMTGTRGQPIALFVPAVYSHRHNAQQVTQMESAKAYQPVINNDNKLKHRKKSRVN